MSNFTVGSSPSKFQVSKMISVIAAGALLTACGGGGSGSSDLASLAQGDASSGAATAVEYAIEGGAIKGVIEQGVVNVYAVENHAGAMIRSAAPVAAAVRTDENGLFSITLRGEEVDSVVVEITADDLTRMTCDVTEGCGDDAQGNPIAFGERFALSSDFELSAAYAGIKSQETNALYVTPLTHLAVSWAERAADGLTPENILTGYAMVEQAFDLPIGALQLPPPDLTRLQQTDGVTVEQLEYAVMSASFLALVNEADWNSIDEVVNHAANRFAQQGALTSVNMGALPEVALSDLFFYAEEIANDLKTTAPSYVSQLNTVAQSASNSYQVVTNPENPIEPVSIVSHPGTVTVNANGSVTLSVQAAGTGPLVYQWRKDGQALTGANSSSYSISNADASDQGAYDVIVSNGAGSVASLSAMVSIAYERNATLSWAIPTLRQDGTGLPLHEIAGYVISYGTSANNLSQQLTINDAQDTQHEFINLAPATWFFSVSTIDTTGNQGAPSTPVSK